MIVRRADSSILLITQPDHAALARRIMEHCTLINESQRRASILHAIGEHDNGWIEPDSEPTLDEAGRVVDFVHAPAELKQGVWPRAVGRLADDPYAAALVAQHAITVYSRFRTDDGWVSFFPTMEALRDHHAARAGVARDDLLGDYAFVRVGDLISLTFCNAWGDDQTYDEWTVRMEHDTCITVTPWVFDASSIRMAVGARRLQTSSFPSPHEFAVALAAAPQVTLSGVVTPPADAPVTIQP